LIKPLKRIVGVDISLYQSGIGFENQGFSSEEKVISIFAKLNLTSLMVW
jgi:hypothetical protein